MKKLVSLFAILLFTMMISLTGCDILGLTDDDSSGDTNTDSPAYVGVWGGDGSFGWGVQYQWFELEETSYQRKVALEGDSGLTNIMFREKGNLSTSSAGTLVFTSTHQWRAANDDDGEFSEDEWVAVETPEAYTFAYTVEGSAINMIKEGETTEYTYSALNTNTTQRDFSVSGAFTTLTNTSSRSFFSRSADYSGMKIAVYSAPSLMDFQEFSFADGVLIRDFTRENFDIQTDGSFSFTPAHRYFAAFLYDPNSSDLNKVTGVLGIDAESAYWQLLDGEAFSSSLDMGIISTSVDDIVLLSELPLSQMTNIAIDTDAITAMAMIDDPVRYLKNYINLDDAYTATFGYKFHNDNIRAFEDTFSNPADNIFSGYSIAINPLITEVAAADAFTLEPPVTISLDADKDGTPESYGPGDPIPGIYNNLTYDMGRITNFEFGYSSEAENLIQIQATDEWTLREADGGAIGVIDSACFQAWDPDTGYVNTLPVPSLKAVTDDQDRIESLEVQWRIWNGTAYVDMNPTLLPEIYGGLSLTHFGDTRVDEMAEFPENQGDKIYLVKDWTFEADNSYTQLTSLHAVCMIGDVTISFTFRNSLGE